MEKQNCPLCTQEMEHLTNQKRTVKFKRPNGILNVELEGISYHWCKDCQEGMYDKEDLILHDRKLKEFHDKRKRDKHLLTADEIKEIRENTGLSQAELENVLGIGKKSFVRWENNKVDQSKSVDLLLRIIRKKGIGIIEEVDLPPFVLTRNIEGSSKEELVEV